MILSSLLHDKIPRQRNRSFTTIMKIHFLLRWLSGGSHHEIMVNMGVSKSTFYNIIDQCMIDIVTCDELAYHFPSSMEEISNAVSDWDECSEGYVITGCVGCADGFLLKINTPSKNKTPNGKDYFSGHYKCHGINIQASCDSKCRFISVSVAAPGATNDIVALKNSKLDIEIHNLPPRCFIIGYRQ